MATQIRLESQESVVEKAWVKAIGDLSLSLKGVTALKDQSPVDGHGTILVAGTAMALQAATGKYVPYDDAGAGGAETCVGFLWETIDTADYDVQATLVDNNARLDESELTGIDANGKTDLAGRNFIYE